MKMIKQVAGAAVMAGALMAGGSAMAQTAEEIAQAKDIIWEMELSIYEGRERGDMSNYRNNVAEGYMAWPPVLAKPMRSDNLGRPGSRGPANEIIKLSFEDFTMNGDVAVIYYSSHRTRRVDGSAADDRFDVTHTWVKRDGQWQVLGGMARATPQL